MDYTAILERIRDDAQPLLGKGRVADYIPQLGKVRPDHFGMALGDAGRALPCGGRCHRAVLHPEHLQAVRLHAGFPTAGRGPVAARRARAFRQCLHSLVQLEYEQGLPRNPFINAGALVVTDVLCSRFVQAESARCSSCAGCAARTASTTTERWRARSWPMPTATRHGAFHEELRPYRDAGAGGDRRLLPSVRDHHELRGTGAPPCSSPTAAWCRGAASACWHRARPSGCRR